MSKVSSNCRQTRPHLVAIQCFVQGLEVSQQPESAHMFHKAETLSCKSQFPFKSGATRGSDCYLSVLPPFEVSGNGAGNKFRASAGREEKSGAGSGVQVAG